MNRHPILYSFLLILLIIFIFSGVFVFFYSLSPRSVERPLFSFGEVAVMKIEGPIFESVDIIRELHGYQKNKSIKAIVIRIDSPGGAVAPSQEIFEELKKLKKTKKVVVSMGSLAASGGYYIASAADKILAQAGTVTGSIGVIMESFGVNKMMDWVRLESRVVKSGKYKDVASPFREMSVEDRQYLQNLLDNMYQQFTTAVSEQRNIPLDKVLEIAEGRIFTGKQALELRLVDGIGTLYDAIDEAKKIAGLSDDADVIWPHEESAPWKWVKSASDQRNMIEGMLKENIDRVLSPQWLYMMSLDSSHQ